MNSSVWTWKTPSALERADVALLKAIQEGEGEWQGEPVPCSRSQIKRLIEEGNVTAEALPIKANQKLREGIEVRIHFPAPREISLKPEERPLEILFEDEHLVVINKPPQLTVHPSTTQTDGTLVNALLHHITDLSGIGGELRPGIVHRIDKDTSGALVVTKTDACHRALVQIFSEHAIERAYWALVFGAPPGPCPSKSPTKIESHIGRNPKDRKKMANVEKGGRKAVSYFRKLEEYSLPHPKSGARPPAPFASFLEVTLETGRTHQVRVHMTSLGHSLLGDPVYGTPTERQPKWLALPAEVRAAVEQMPGQALHARILGFVHPMTGQKLRFEAEPPQSFSHLLATLRKYQHQAEIIEY
jgi:23S rRNA pseudouridine1911/1915/1917 synthase